MDCLNPAPKGDREPALLKHNKPRGTSKLTKALLFLLSILFIVLLAVVIWLGVEVHKCRSDIDDLKRGFSGVSTQSSSANTASLGSGGSTGSTTEYAALYLSQNSTSASGYVYSGSLYRGSGYWAAQAPLPGPRADFVSLNLDETLYQIGGHDGEDNYLTQGISLSVLANVTNNFSAMPSARSHFAAGSPDNTSIIVAGGYSSEANENRNIPENCTLLYNVSSDAWSTGPCLVQGRGSACGAVVNGKLFVVGGLGMGGEALSSIEQYHPDNSSWTTFAQMPSARSDVGCAASGNNLIVAGGTDSSGSGDLKEVLAFDSDTATISQLQDLLHARFDFGLVGIPGGDVLAVSGGQHVNGTEVGLHYVERYSVASDQWVEKAMIADRRFAFGATFINEGIYVSGGHIFCNDTLTEDCGNRVRDSVEVLYDSDHPDVFLHLQQPGVQVTGPPPNASQVLLLGSGEASFNGYTDAGSLYRGSGYWAQGSDLPQPLSDLNVVSNGDSVYIVGGLDVEGGGQDAAVDTLYRYDPVLDQYADLSALPEPRTRGAAEVLGGSLYYVGGFDSGDDAAEPLATMLVYNISSDTWAQSSASLESARSDLCMAAVNGTLYSAGGYDTNYTSTLNLAQRFDPNSNAWVSIPSMPTPRGDVMCAALNGEFVVAGGYYDPINEFTPASFRTEVEAYSPATGTWRSLAPLPVARGDAAMTAVPSQFGARLIVMGGESEIDNERTGVATHQVQEYSSALDEWTLKAPMITPRFRHDAAYAEGHVLTFGGASSSVCANDGDGLSPCTLRPVATTDEFFDTDNPDVFVYTAF